jgi:hypothetical protein
MLSITPKFKACLALTLGLVAVQGAQALSQLHPSFTVKRLLPEAMATIPGIGGLDFLPNGDGVITTWGGSQKSTGEIWIVTGLASGEPGTATRIATGLREPLGLKVVGSDFYLLEKSRISKYTGSGTNFTRSNHFNLPTAWYNDGQWHHFAFGLAFRDSAFWFTTGTAYDYTPADPIQRGALIRVPLNGSGFTQHARGLRNPAGLALGPENEFFSPENEGHWKPINVLYHLPTKNMPTNGRFYGFRTTGNNACGTTPSNVAGDNCPNDPEYPPAVWIPYGTDFSSARFSQSPTEPILLKTGPYAGQMIGGDVFRGGILRYYLEKVGDDYQGAVFDFMTGGSQGINFGAFKMLYTTTGNSILVAGIGGGASTANCVLGGSNNWNYNGACRGLDLLTHTTTAPFEMLAIRSLPDGFEIEFTKPAGASAGTAANYGVRTSVHTAVQTYGQDAATNDNNIAVGVTSATLSPDGKKVTLKLASLLTRRMYAFTLNNITSATNEAMYTNIGYYTLNKVQTTVVNVAASVPQPGKLTAFEADRRLWRIDATEAYDLSLARPDGRIVTRVADKVAQTVSLQGLDAGVYLVSGQVGGKAYRQSLVLR